MLTSLFGSLMSNLIPLIFQMILEIILGGTMAG